MFAALKHAIRRLAHRESRVAFSVRYQELRTLLERNNRIQELIADMEDKLSGAYIYDRQYIVSACEQLFDLVLKQIAELSALSGAVQRRHSDELFVVFENTQRTIRDELEGLRRFDSERLIVPLEEASRDMSDEVGVKNAYLAQVRNVLGLDIPTGFAVTFRACEEFQKENGLIELLREEEQALEKTLARGKGQEIRLVEAASQRVVRRIMEGDIPRRLAREARRAAAGILEGARYVDPKASLTFAVRSSAWDEDGTPGSFAGQNKTVLNTPMSGLLDAYKQVLAGAYSRRCWLYRLHRGFRERDGGMAVGVQVMIDATVSGVMYTLDPAGPLCTASDDQGCMLVGSVWGCGAPVTDGSAPADYFRLERTPPFKVTESRIADKSRRMVLLPEGGVGFQDENPALRQAPSLTAGQLTRLAETAMRLERYDKRPQDIEWAFGKHGKLIILQVRPLVLEGLGAPACAAIEQATQQAEIIFSGQGMVAQRGVAVGAIFVLDDMESLDQTPAGSILVTRLASPRLSRVMPRIHGLITELGSPTGHLATMAREFHVPTLVNVGPAVEKLHTGDQATLDTEHGVLYRGAIEGLRLFELVEEEAFEDSAEYRLLRRVLRYISPQRPADPQDQALHPSRRYTINDICRHVHEVAVSSIVELSERHGKDYPPPRPVRTRLPLGLVALDIGGGMDKVAHGHVVSEGDIRCTPLNALLEGMNCPAMWPTDPVPVGLGSFMSSFTRTVSSSLATPERVGRNLAVVSEEYLYLGLRLGYHFTMVESYVADKPEENYASFRFLGGVTHVDRRSRRARFVAAILTHFDFHAETHGDLAIGRFKMWPRQRMEDNLRMLGWLIGYTRQLDALLHGEAQVDHHIADFLRRAEEQTEAYRDNQS